MVRCYIACDLRSLWGKNLPATSGKTEVLSPKCEKHGLNLGTASNEETEPPGSNPGWDTAKQLCLDLTPGSTASLAKIFGSQADSQTVRSSLKQANVF